MLNQVFLMGRVATDITMRQTNSGRNVCSFRVAVDRDFKDKETGERQADFIDVTAWRNTADFINNYFSKGKMIVIVGSLQIRQWEDKDGNKRRNCEVVAETVYFADSKREPQPEGNAQESSFQNEQSGFGEIGEGDNGLPF